MNNLQIRNKIFKIVENLIWESRIEELEYVLERAKDKSYTKKLLIEYIEIMIEELRKNIK